MYLLQPLVIILFAVSLRILPHVPNIAPIAAMGLFGGVYFNKRYAVMVPLIALFLSDIFLGFYKGMPFVYGSFLLTGLIGIWLRAHKSTGTILLGTTISSLLFFLITNFGVWLQSGMYQHTWQGFLDCYVLAIPFFRNTLVGDFFFVGLFFGSYELVIYLFQKNRVSLESSYRRLENSKGK
jgi:uncharacterized membrane protein